MKKGTKIIFIIVSFVVIVAIVFGILYFTKKSANLINIEQKSTGTAEYLFALKTPYVGDNSSVSKLLDTLDIGNYGKYTFELKTNEKPYKIIINYNVIEGWGNILDDSDAVIEKSAILLALIDNADEIHWVLPNNEIRKIASNDLLEKYGNIKEYGQSVKDFNRLLVKLNYYEEKEVITMSIVKLKNKGLTLKIENNTNNKYLYGESYSVERKENDKWVKVEGMPEVFISIGYTLKANQKVEKEHSWSIKLPRGQYRITKDFDHLISETNNGFEFRKKHIISVEFVIK